MAAQHLPAERHGVRGAVRPPGLYAVPARCTRSKREPRLIGLQAREQYEALQAARKQQDTVEFREAYAARAGIEATHGQAVRRCGLRRCRYIGLAKTHLQHLISAAAINLARIANWVNGILEDDAL
jgi:transposase